MLLVRSLREDDLALWTRPADVMKCQGDVIIQIRGREKENSREKERDGEAEKGGKRGDI